MKFLNICVVSLGLAGVLTSCAHQPTYIGGTGDLGLIVERAQGRIAVLKTSDPQLLGFVPGFGDLSHASAVYSRDGRYAFVFGRDGGLTKVDLLEQKIVKRVLQAGNSIGGAISQDGQLVAVSNYEPGGVKVFSTDALELIADLPAKTDDGRYSKVVGLVDAPGQMFVFSLFEAGETWVADLTDRKNIKVEKLKAGREPYDALITGDGRYYIAGLFGEDGLALLDLWHPEKGMTKVLSGYGKGKQKLPVYKMPHLEGWAAAGDYFFLPAIGAKEVLVMNKNTWSIHTRIPLIGQPVFAMASPDGRQVWVNFAFPDNENLQVVDVKTLKVVKHLKPGKGVLHMEFTPRGDQLWLSVRDEDRVEVWDPTRFIKLKEMTVQKPSGIFMSSRAHRIGL
ncbi:MAG: protein nirF [Bdellovibrionaceae bacterium]|nr:hypothetical protein [Bdellovibrionales bacterium]MCB9083043.1 protein nirF [Pseudobdellovibrionaceae bacterium]